MSRTWRGSVTWEHEQTPTDVELEEFVMGLPGYGVVEHDAGRGTLTARMTIEAATLRAATDETLKAARSAHGVFGAAGDPIEVRVLTDERWANELAHPAELDLIGTAEIAEILGVKPQRVGQLADEHPLFPKPVGKPKAGRMWTRASVEAFAASDWRRKPGPKRTAES